MEAIESCPACMGVRVIHVTDRGLDFAGERVWGCLRCGACFLSPRMTEEELERYYRDDYAGRYRGSAVPTAELVAARDRAAQYRASRLASWGVLTSGRTLLEVGCGAGNFLAACRERGLQAFGIEPGASWATAACARGLAVEVGQFPHVHGERSEYDIIAMFHVLEHLPHPMEALAHARALLSAGGVLVVEVPDLSRAFGPRWSERYFHRPHLVEYTHGALVHLLARAGFEATHTDYCQDQRRRRHHLLLAARPAMPPCSELGWREAGRAALSLARLRAWIGLSRATRATVVRLRTWVTHQAE